MNLNRLRVNFAQVFESLTPRQALRVACGMTVLLSGCALSDENLSRVMVAPGKFSLYTCPELVTKGKELAKRERELAGLMAKARTSAGGGVVSELAYRPDYVAAQGEMRDVREAAAAKQCDLSAVNAEGAAAPSAGQTAPR